MAIDGNLFGRNPTQILRSRILAAMWATGVVFLILASRLYWLQILRGEELRSKGRRNFGQQVLVKHDRGIIYDREGRILADNRPSIDVQVTPAFLGGRESARDTLQQLALLVDVADEDLASIEESVLAQKGLDRFQPIVFQRDLTPEQVEAVESERSVFHLDGVDITEGRRRTYPRGRTAAHLLGYVKEIDGPQLDAERARGNPLHYYLGDFIGRDGVERSYESVLRGVDGYEKIVVDAKGRRQHGRLIRELLGAQPRVEPKPGKNVFLTIDAELQGRAEAAFDGRAGAVVALEVKTGRVLVLASFPGFQPSLVSGLLGKDEKRRLDTDPLKPWINRTISGQYAPGSTFKVVTALAALGGRDTSPKEKIRCPGFFRMGRAVWRCYKESGHGPVDLRTAIKVSCDTYFYTLGARLGIDAIAEMGHQLGLGQRTGIKLRNEQPGLMPDRAFHDRVDRATGGYQRGMAVNTAIGQGSVLLTPLQLALVYATVANGGVLFEPQIVDRIESADFRVTHRFLPRARVVPFGANAEAKGERSPPAGNIREETWGRAPVVLERTVPASRGQLVVSPEDLQAVREGLTAVASEPGGTAYWRRSRKVSMAGKTGTAQVVRLGRERLRAEQIDYYERDHAWFAAYAPVEDPELVVAVLNEHSGHGSSHAAPIAVRVIDAYFEQKHQPIADPRGPGGVP